MAKLTIEVSAEDMEKALESAYQKHLQNLRDHHRCAFKGKYKEKS